MSRLFRKKPIEIRAVQWTGENLDEVQALLGVDPEDPGDRPYVAPDFEDVAYVVVTTAQGQQVSAKPGEWIVPEAQPGRGYPIAPDVLSATYDEITGEG